MKYKKKILVIDDDQLTLKTTSKILMDEGHNVLIAMTGGISIHIAKNEKPDLILLDIVMPGVDGIGFLHLMKQNELEHIPVIIISSLKEEELELKNINTKIVGYIKKPFSYSTLIEMINTIT